MGSFAPNAFGLFDMVGNVWEWTQDCWHDTYEGAPSDGSAWISGGDCSKRVDRGGAFVSFPTIIRCAERWGYPADAHLDAVGFRLARELP